MQILEYVQGTLIDQRREWTAVPEGDLGRVQGAGESLQAVGTALLSPNAIELGAFPVPPAWFSFTAVWPSDWVCRLGSEDLGSNLASVSY